MEYHVITQLRVICLLDIKTLGELLHKMDLLVKNENSLQILVNHMKDGFLPKNVFQKLFEEHCEKQTSFFMELNNLKEAKQIFLATNLDKNKIIFQKKQCWYYIPGMATNSPEVNKESFEENTPDHLLVFNINSITEKLEYWTASILYDFCTASTIKIFKNYCSGSVGNLKVKIHIQPKKQCQILLNHDKDEKSQNHALLLLEGIKSSISNSFPLQLYLTYSHTRNQA